MLEIVEKLQKRHLRRFIQKTTNEVYEKYFNESFESYSKENENFDYVMDDVYSEMNGILQEKIHNQMCLFKSEISLHDIQTETENNPFNDMLFDLWYIFTDCLFSEWEPETETPEKFIQIEKQLRANWKGKVSNE